MKKCWLAREPKSSDPLMFGSFGSLPTLPEAATLLFLTLVLESIDRNEFFGRKEAFAMAVRSFPDVND